MSSPNFEKSDFETDGMEDVALDGGLLNEDALEEGAIEGDAFDAGAAELGKTSDETQSVGAAGTEDPKRQFSVFDAMLLVSLVCVTLATVLLLFALRDYGNFPSVFPWRTSEF